MAVNAGRASLQDYLAGLGRNRFVNMPSVLEVGIAGDRDSTGNVCPGANREFFPSITYRTADIDPALNPDIVVNLEETDMLPLCLAFDLVICSQTLEHVWDIKAAARSLYYLTEPGGWCLVDTPFLAPVHYGGDKCGDWWRLTAPALARLMHEAGFATVESYEEPSHLHKPGEPSWVAAVCKRSA